MLPLQLLLEHTRVPASAPALKLPLLSHTKANPADAPAVIWPARQTGTQKSPVVVELVHEL
jgi:hypothetical protein